MIDKKYDRMALKKKKINKIQFRSNPPTNFVPGFAASIL